MKPRKPVPLEARCFWTTISGHACKRRAYWLTGVGRLCTSHRNQHLLYPTKAARRRGLLAARLLKAELA
jgi:hypothetical protein